MDNILRKFSKNIKKQRMLKGWSQEELAQKAGLHRTYIGAIERSERNVSLINVERIANALGLNVEKILR